MCLKCIKRAAGENFLKLQGILLKILILGGYLRIFFVPPPCGPLPCDHRGGDFPKLIQKTHPPQKIPPPPGGGGDFPAGGGGMLPLL